MLDTSSVALVPGFEGLWQDFDQRLRWKGMNGSLVPGSEIRRYGGGLTDALRGSGSLVRQNLRIVGSPCIFVNGVPKPGWPLAAFEIDDIEAVEVYGPTDEAAKMLAKAWPGSPCGGRGRNSAADHAIVQWVVIWTKR